MANCVSGWAMVQRQTAIIPDIFDDKRVPKAAYRGTFVRSMAMAPMGRDEPQGAIGAYWAQVYDPTVSEIESLNRLAQAAGTALQRLDRPETQQQRAANDDGAVGAWRLALPFTDPRQQLLRLLPVETLPFLSGQLLAVGAVGLTAVARMALNPMMGTTGLFTSFIPAILITTLWGGPRAAATALILSITAGASIDVLINDHHNFVGRLGGWLIFTLVGAFVAVVASLVRTALDLHETRRDALEVRDEHLGRISRELDHRSRNTLAVAAALAGHAARSSKTATEMHAKLAAHFEAMGQAQKLVLTGSSGGVPVRKLMESSLAPFVSEGTVALDLPSDLAAPSGCEVMLTLAFHELATNACKYGALAADGGCVSVTGTSDGELVTLVWSESGGSKVAEPARRSTGSRLIQRALSGAPDGKVEISYLPAGLVCAMSWSTIRN